MPEPKRPLKVFLCHAHADRDPVRGLYTRLTQDGVDAWLDKAKLLPGQDWELEIRKAVYEADVVVVCLSNQFNQRGFRQKEVRLALDTAMEMPEGEIFIIPARLEECDNLESLRRWHWVDLFEGDGYEKLLQALQVRAEKSGASLIYRIERKFGEKVQSNLGLKNPKEKKTVSNTAKFFSNLNFLVGIAMIVFAILIVLGLFNLQLIERWLNPTVTPTATVAVTATTSIETPSAIPSAISSWLQGRIAYVTRNSENIYSLHTFDLFQDDQPQLVLMPNSPTDSRYYAPWFAPNGHQLAFDDRYTGKVFLVDVLEKNGVQFIGSCFSPSFSPDGTRIVCDANGADYFPIYDVKSGARIDAINHGKNGSLLPAWSPNGTEVVFSVLEGSGKASIWKVDIDGNNPVPLAVSANEDYAPSWSPDGEWIAYQSTLTSDKSAIWIMRRDGSEQKQITFNGGAEIWSRGPCFSPDGKWLAFVSNQDGSDGSDFGDVFVISLLTGEIHKITDTGGQVLDWRVTWAD